MNDLSEYEKERLRNIRRNQEYLRKLGLDDVTAALQKKKKVRKKKKAANEKRTKKKKTETLPVTRRRSRRLQTKTEALNEVKDASSSDEEDNSVNYSKPAIDSDRLDDFEYEIYVRFKKWRLMRQRNSIDIDRAYKIFQNRTLCEFVRRRRNDDAWASGKAIKVREDLLDAWGVGPSKVEGCAHSKKGFANELLDYMESISIWMNKKLKASRALSS